MQGDAGDTFAVFSRGSCFFVVFVVQFLQFSSCKCLLQMMQGKLEMLAGDSADAGLAGGLLAACTSSLAAPRTPPRFPFFPCWFADLIPAKETCHHGMTCSMAG